MIEQTNYYCECGKIFRGPLHPLGIIVKCPKCFAIMSSKHTQPPSPKFTIEEEDISERLSLAPFFHPPTVTENSWTLGMSGFSSKEEALEDCYRRFRGYAYEARHDPRVKVVIGRMILEELSKLKTLSLANILQSNGYSNGDEWLRNLKIKE